MTEQTAAQRVASHWSITCATEIRAAIDAEIASAVAKEREACALVLINQYSCHAGDQFEEAANQIRARATAQAGIDFLGRCPECDLNWVFNPTVKVDGHNKRRCIECKTLFDVPPQPEPQENV